MNEETKLNDSQKEKHLAEILEILTDPLHIRIIEKYQGDDPVQAMETELGEIIMEIITRED
jgi:hypothetical protein